MKRKLLMMMVTILSIFASINAAGACSVHFYQPDVPKALRK